MLPAPVGCTMLPVAKVTCLLAWYTSRMVSRAENFTSPPLRRMSARSRALSFSSAGSLPRSMNFRSCSSSSFSTSEISPFILATFSISARYSACLPSFSRASAFSSSVVRWLFSSISLRLISMLLLKFSFFPAPAGPRPARLRLGSLFDRALRPWDHFPGPPARHTV